MTELNALADRAVPTKATFDVGEYSDGSGPVVQVSYDAQAGPTSDRVWLETSPDSWIAFDAEYAAELCAAIMTAAQSIAALRAQGEA